MNFILETYNKLKCEVDGKKKFSELVCQITPYFATINPEVIELKPGYGAWAMSKVKSVENHIGTVHAIAMCNLAEITAGLTTEVSIPPHKRWIPMGMEVKYLKKAKTDLTAYCDLGEVNWDAVDVLETIVEVKDANNEEVMSASIRMKISDKPHEDKTSS